MSHQHGSTLEGDLGAVCERSGTGEKQGGDSPTRGLSAGRLLLTGYCLAGGGDIVGPASLGTFERTLLGTHQGIRFT